MRLSILLLLFASLATAQDRPNILWITAEDHGPHMGAYGDDYADTPTIDALAAKGMTYTRAWSTAPVCAPARTTIISGVYPPSSGSQHMRSMTRLPASMKMYPQYLREAGYYATNNSKEDYNLEKPGQVWDESSREAHWRKRKNKKQPFFAIFNFTQSHESQLRTRPHEQVHDPAGVRVPAYHPDEPEVRQDWAQYYDKITLVDSLAGEVLDQLEKDKLSEDTIIFYYADHGSGMPRNKRWTYNSGLHVPLIVYFPEKWRHLAGPDYRPGGASNRLVGFIDLAPTLLSLAGVEPPAHMQGQAFLGEHARPPRPYNYGFRGRMDERYDMVRAVRDHRFIYIRNYKPHRIYGQFIRYMFQTPTTQVWFDKFGGSQVGDPREAFWNEKPAEELYDLLTDRDEVSNLASLPQHRDTLVRMRQALASWQLHIRDLGFLPEGEIHTRSAGTTPYQMGHDDYRYPYQRVRDAAALASSLGSDIGAYQRLSAGFADDDSAVRYWAALGGLMRKQNGVKTLNRELHAALTDESPYVRIAAGEALGRFGDSFESKRALEVLLDLAPLDKNGLYVSMEALNAIDYLDERAASARDRIAQLPKEHASVPRRLGGYVSNLIEKILADLQ